MPIAGGDNILADTIAARPEEAVPDEKAPRLSFNIPEALKPQNKTASILVVDEDDAEFIEPTEEESKILRKVAENLPLVSFSLCLVEFAERASYYGAKTVFSNFIQFPLPKGGNGAGAPARGTQDTAGALGMGLQASSGLTTLFTFLAYVVPIFGGWWADVHVGRYYAIVVGVIICGVAHVVQLVGAIPSVLQQGPSHAMAPFVIGLLLLSVGAGIFKPNVAPVIIDQHRHQKAHVKTLKSGEKVIVDPETTTTRTMLIFHGFVNVGAFFMIATTYSEKYIGFWAAFLEAGMIYFLLPILLAAIYKKTYRRPPAGSSELTNAFKIIGVAVRESHFRVWRKGFWDAAKPSTLATRGISVDWTEKNVEEVRRTVAATEVFLYFPIWYMNDGGIGTVQTNQGASMTTNGVPNDLINNFNPLTIMIAIPIMSYIMYPTLDRLRIKFGRISRLTFGFSVAAISGMIGAIVQWKVYETSPCGYYASTCDDVSPLSIWWQLPNAVLGAWSECFCQVTAYQMAYARSPPSMRGLVFAIFLFMNALNSAMAEILIPVITDPYLIWVWAGPAIALVIQTIFFWYRFHKLNDDEYMLEESPPQTHEPSAIESGSVKSNSSQVDRSENEEASRDEKRAADGGSSIAESKEDKEIK